ncbi:hypothetical protein Scep_005634 [Stephania cephalantha]|uniref:Protein root UVB sensitive 5 n=1 Tax=Stephania cephalantha TaxID=152367 RepID=A0AAP0KXB0_9MAGN
MPYALQLSFPAFALAHSRSRAGLILCSSLQSNTHGEEEDGDGEKKRFQGQSKLVLVERCGNGTAKRYVMEEDSRVPIILEEFESTDRGLGSLSLSNKELSWLPDSVKDFILPAGFPGTVSDDYLEYMLFQLPTNVTGWICHTLVTSSLLKAVGVGSFSGSTAAATAAAIRWVSKDGLGAIGRLFIGGRFGNLFDDDPKQWRMYADFIGSAGSIFDLSTPLFPSYFLALASLGNLTKAVAKGLKDPSFRVIQNHFAVSGNLGEVAAKEEVWEVVAQLLGLALGVLVLDTPDIQASYTMLVSTWLSIRLFHLWLRYQSLSVLRFNTINLKRARILVKSHILKSTVPGYVDCNREEDILAWQRFSKPQINFGVSLEEMIAQEESISSVKALLELYAREKYVLSFQRPGFRAFVSFKVGATSLSVLRSLWQTYWVYENCRDSCDSLDQLRQSLVELENKFGDFVKQLEEAGWDVNQLKLKVPSQFLIEEAVQQ